MGAQPILSSPGCPRNSAVASSLLPSLMVSRNLSRDWLVADSYPAPGTLKPSVIAGLPAAWASRGRLQRAG